MQPTLTVFTSTYNRAYCLHKGYEALKRQTLKDFIWLIVDDGSTDTTRELVQSWQTLDNGFLIQYIYKQNGGMYTGYNAAIERCSTELAVCVDSDDYLTDNAVEKIVTFWKQNGSNNYAGILGLDCFENGDIVGDPLPPQKSINLIDILLGNYAFKNGDRKNVLRTALYKQVAPMKEFPEERDANPHYMHIEISKQYDFLVLNEKLCVVEYLPDGMHTTIFKQYKRSPRSFREMRLQYLALPHAPLTFVIKHTMHYISSCLFSGTPCITASPRKLSTTLLYPLGVLWHLYLVLYNWRAERKQAKA